MNRRLLSRIAFASALALASAALAPQPATAKGLVFLPIDADSVDGFDASQAPRAGHLLPLNAFGYFPYSVMPPCGQGQVIKMQLAGWDCAPDEGGAYSAGAGLLLSGTTFSANFTPGGGDNGAAVAVARGDHAHDARYFTESELQAPGTINVVGNPVDWTRIKGVPQGFADGVDDTLAGPATDVTCAGCVDGSDIASGAVGAAQLADGSVGVADLAFDPATQAELEVHKGSADHDGRYFTEAELSAPGTVNADSNPVDWTKLNGVPAGFADGTDDGGISAPAFSRSFVDTTGGITGQYTSMAIGVDGLGLISYSEFNLGTNRLQVAHCSDLVCSSATISVIDSAGNVGWNTSIAIGADGLGLISYFDIANRDLKVAHCSNVLCTSATTATIDSSGDVGRESSLTIGADGLGLVAYWDVTLTPRLKIAHCANTACTSATTIAVDVAGAGISITIGADGLGIVAYVMSDDLKIAHCSDVACTSATTAVVDAAGIIRYPAIAIGREGLALVAYYEDTNVDLKLAHCSDMACTAATTAVLDPSARLTTRGSITIGSDGLGVISYDHLIASGVGTTDFDLRVAHCTNTSCTGATVATVESELSSGRDSSVTVAPDGLPLISYNYDSTGDLKVAHCSNVFCVPFHRPR